MAETENKKEKTKKPKKKNQSNLKLDKSVIIFFTIIIIALIGFTILVLVQETKKTYITSFGEDMSSKIIIDDKMTKMDIIVNVKGVETKQHGKLSNITSEDTNDGVNVYEVELDVGENITEKVIIEIKDNELTLLYDDGTKVIYKEM